MSHYRVLGVPTGATRAEIRTAYVEAARAAHPDLRAGDGTTARADAADRIRAVNEAWRVLGDPARRRIYDRHRVAAAAGATSAPSSAPATGATVYTPRRPTPGPERVAERPGRRPGRAPDGGHGNPMVMLPAIVLAAAVVQLFVGLVFGLSPLLASGAITFGLGIAGFAAAPLLVLAGSRNRRSVPG